MPGRVIVGDSVVVGLRSICDVNRLSAITSHWLLLYVTLKEHKMHYRHFAYLYRKSQSHAANDKIK